MNDSVRKRSLLLRIAVWLVVVCAVVAPIWLGFEFYQYVQSIPGKGWDFRIARIVGLLFANSIFTAVVAVLGLLFLWVRLAASLPDLQGWHLDKPASEFSALDAEPEYSFDDYLAQEGRVFQELASMIRGTWMKYTQGDFNRFSETSICNPEKIVERNWNRSHVLESPEPVGGVLLVHGLSDSPYSLRKLGERLHREGYTVIWLRVPGHGTSPSALANVSCRDWTAAVRVAVQGVRQRIPDHCPLILGGYSNGGALCVQYALASIEDESLAKVDAITLFSPMIGINPMARITRLYHTVALVSGNKKAQWSNLDAEVDPFKYSSWPMNASVQAWNITQAVERGLAKLAKAGRAEELPPILAMQSVVDSTVVVPKLITALFNRLKSRSSELFLFDINRLDQLGNLFNFSFETKVFPKLERTDLPYQLTVLKNEHPRSMKVVIQSRKEETWEEQTTDLVWPPSVASLSHVAVPIPPDDRVYGTQESTAETGLSLGSTSIRAEPSALMLSSSLFTRCRNNPFYYLMEDRVIQWLDSVLRPPRSTQD